MTMGIGLASPELPKRQLAILAIARFAEPLAYTSVFPYLPEMISDFGIEKDKIAKWAGLTSAVFSIAQSITAVPWGKASDIYGRKPVLICGLFATMITFVIWGMSTSLTMAIIVRAIQGGGNGNVGIIRTMVAEMVPQKELQPVAFSVMPLVWSLGSVVGPAFGGFFAQPAKQFPRVFGGIDFFERFPYALPNLIATVFFMISAACAIFFLQETLTAKKGQRDVGLVMGERISRAFRRRRGPHGRRSSFVDGQATAPLIPSKSMSKKASAEKTSSPTMKEVFTRQTTINLVAYTFLAFHSVAYDQNITVFLNYPVVEHTPENTEFPFYFSGGFGLRSGQIGTIFTLYGITCGLIQFLVYPPLVTRFGVLKCFRVCSVILPFIYFLTPYTVLFPTQQTRFAAMLALMFIKAFCVIICFPSTTILLTNSAASLRILGTLNGFATTFSGIGRALGPATTGLAFSWGAENGYVITAYYFLALIAAIGAIPIYMIVEGDGPTATAESSDTEEDNDSLRDSAATLLVDSSLDDSGDEASALLKRPGQGSGYQTIGGSNARE